MGRVTVSVENSRQGGGCERVSEVPHGSVGGALLGKWGRDLASSMCLLCNCVSAGAACVGEVPVPLRGGLRSVLPALPWPHVQHLSQTVHLGVQV